MCSCSTSTHKFANPPSSDLHSSWPPPFSAAGDDGGELFAFCEYKDLKSAAAARKAMHQKAVPALAGPSRVLIVAFKTPRR